MLVRAFCQNIHSAQNPVLEALRKTDGKGERRQNCNVQIQTNFCTPALGVETEDDMKLDGDDWDGILSALECAPVGGLAGENDSPDLLRNRVAAIFAVVARCNDGMADDTPMFVAFLCWLTDSSANHKSCM